MRPMWELRVPLFGHYPEGYLHMCEMDMEHFTNNTLCVLVTKCWFLGFVVRDWTFMCLFFTAILTWMTWLICLYEHKWQPFRLRMFVPHSCLYVIRIAIIKSGGSMSMKRHEVAATDSETVYGCNQTVWLRPSPCTWWNSWSPDDWCSWPSMGCCCCNHR